MNKHKFTGAVIIFILWNLNLKIWISPPKQNIMLYLCVALLKAQMKFPWYFRILSVEKAQFAMAKDSLHLCLILFYTIKKVTKCLYLNHPNLKKILHFPSKWYDFPLYVFLISFFYFPKNNPSTPQLESSLFFSIRKTERPPPLRELFQHLIETWGTFGTQVGWVVWGFSILPTFTNPSQALRTLMEFPSERKEKNMRKHLTAHVKSWLVNDRILIHGLSYIPTG